MKGTMKGLKEILPFENDAHLEHSPILVKIHKPKNKTQKKLLLTKRKEKKYREKLKKYYSYFSDEYLDSWIEKAKKYIYMVHDLQTGKTRYSTLYPFDGINEYVLTEEERRRWVVNSYSRKHKKYIYDQCIINGIPVFRFFVFYIDFVRPGRMKQGYYENFRIYFKDGKFWMETRENISEYKMGYKTQSFYKYQCVNKVNLYETCPSLFLHQNNYSPRESQKYAADYVKITKDNYNAYYTSSGERKYRRHVSINFEREILMGFNEFYTVMTSQKNNGISKNTPKQIREHLENNLVCENVEQRKKLEYISMKSYVNNPHGYNNKFSKNPYTMIMQQINENLCVYRYFKNCVEVARIYFTPKRQYKFFFDFNAFKWDSTRNENFFYRRFATKNYLKENKTILNRVSYKKTKPQYISILTQMCLKYVVVEQLAKIANVDIIKTLLTDLDNYNFKGVIKFAENFKKFRNAKNLNEWLTFGSKNLKHLRKDVSFNQLCYLNDKFKDLNRRYFKKDTIVTIKALDICDFSYSTLKKIRKYYRGDAEGFYNFWKVLVNRENATAEFSIYLDYCQMVPSANTFARHTFGYKIKPKDIRIYHRRITTDYNDYLRAKRELENAQFEENFKNVVKEKNYQQFMFEDENFKLVSPINSEDLVIEGRTLSHCVGSYRHKMAQGNSFIYFIRKKDDIETPYYTMEIVPTLIKEKTKKDPAVYSYDINQIFGYGDKTIDNDELRNFIEKFKSANEIIKHYGYLRFGGADYWG